MSVINFQDILAIFRRDKELQKRIAGWSGEVSGLYVKYLPAFEVFLAQLPDDLTLEELDATLRKHPVDFRLLFASRMSQFCDRCESGYVTPTYRSLSDFLRVELYQNHPDKINYRS